MDIATGLGLVAGAAVIITLILMGGDLRMFYDIHAIIIIFGGSFAATLIRFPLNAIFHGLPLGAKFAFTMSNTTPRELVDEIAGIAEVARKSGPLGLEKIVPEDPFLAKGIRFVADGYDADFIRDNLERDRDNFLTHLQEGQNIYRSIGDCAPALWHDRHPHRNGADVRQHDRSGETRSVHGRGFARDLLRRSRRESVLLADRRQAACEVAR